MAITCIFLDLQIQDNINVQPNVEAGSQDLSRSLGLAMPPQRRKSTKNLLGAAAAPVGSAAVAQSDVPMPSSMNLVGPLQRDVALCVELMYSLRHGLQTKRPLESEPDECELLSGVPVPGDDGAYPFPLSEGGTFMEIAQRAQFNDKGKWLLKESAEMCYAAGFLETADPEELKEKYMTPSAHRFKFIKCYILCPLGLGFCLFCFVLFFLGGFCLDDQFMTRRGHQSWACNSARACCAGALETRASGEADLLGCPRLCPTPSPWLSQDSVRRVVHGKYLSKVNRLVIIIL